jgi:glycosyltransferase involved in cell wall biosynthesis
VKQQTLKPHEIILVLDPDLNLSEFYSSRVPSGIILVTSKEVGLSNARNAGVEVAQGDVVAFIDDDATADENWLGNLVENFRDDNVAGAGGYAKAVWDDGRPVWFAEELDWAVGCSYRGGPRERCYVRNPLGCNMAFRHHVFREIGLFRPGFGRFGRVLLGSEEAEFSIRLSSTMASARMVYDPSAVVYHRVSKIRGSFRYLLRRSFYEGVSKALIGTAHSNIANLLFAEREYLRYLVLVSIPERLTRIYDWRKLAELFAILASMMLVLIGYFVEGLRPHSDLLASQRR